MKKVKNPNQNKEKKRSLKLSNGMRKISKKYVVGIDEAGRGPIAGPVSVGLVCWTSDVQSEVLKELKGIKDSKKLSPKKREEWFQKLRELQRGNRLIFSNALISSKVIDRLGVVPAIKIGIEKCLLKVKANPKNTFIYLDGTLSAPEEFKQKTVIKGDEKIPIVGAASIVAKVLRDRLMVRMSLKYPKYGFEKHKGYGTAEHYKNIKKFGLTEVHRRTFIES